MSENEEGVNNTPEDDETPEPIKLRSFFEEMLQQGFNEKSAGIGAQIVTDWIVVAEVNNGETQMLRIVDSGLPLWRSMGLLRFALQDADNDLLILNSQEDDVD